MNIALIGYGKMGKEIEKVARERGHFISVIIDINDQQKFNSVEFKNSDIAIEFTNPETAVENYKKCFEHTIPVVSGTTGWLSGLEKIKQLCEEENQTFFYASNYSMGVNIFFALNRYLARIMNIFDRYDVNITEIHHVHKLDTPSGTAITLAEDIVKENKRKTNWTIEQGKEKDSIYIQSKREGEVPGIHEVKYESETDVISIKHDAKNRFGFALGAVLAAEFTYGKKGFLGMKDMFDF